MKRAFLTLLTLIIGMTSLESIGQSLPSPSTLFKANLTFGNGGGIAGKYHEYSLYEDGRILMKEKDKEPTELSVLSKDSTAAIFVEARTLFKKTKNFKHPGNAYSFIKLTEKKKTCEATWGSIHFKTPVLCKPFYAKLMKIVENR